MISVNLLASILLIFEDRQASRKAVWEIGRVRTSSFQQFIPGFELQLCLKRNKS
jgi:hypothetical protein